MDMKNIKVSRYDDTAIDGVSGVKSMGWLGYIEPEDDSWIIFISAEPGQNQLYTKRGPSGAVLSDAIRF